MKNVKHCLLFLASLLVLTSCQTPTTREIADYVGRPELGIPCIANGDGTCFENGEIKETTNMLCAPPTTWNLGQDHLENMEYYTYRCKKFGRCK